MITKIANTFWVEIYISGPLTVIEQTLREDCFREGLCVTVTPTKFIYTGGEESGAVIGLINYPRFPAEPETIIGRAKKIAETLLGKTFQHSVLVMTPNDAIWMTLREEQKASTK